MWDQLKQKQIWTAEISQLAHCPGSSPFNLNSQVCCRECVCVRHGVCKLYLVRTCLVNNCSSEGWKQQQVDWETVCETPDLLPQIWHIWELLINAVFLINVLFYQNVLLLFFYLHHPGVTTYNYSRSVNIWT